ncbi:HEAT repeat-containing protein 3 [Holothuria leucospilota]|uniref:HEAT repeat-containing protein 3 n=1 Tax=Holothuria leucospilota TaxID=206669 RepID=A0A9Q1HE39_HOLLE|nr:HEAT repeat-containing protein 3 [Holothuria leucospilota]
MGKAKKKKFRPPKQRPTGLPSVKETTENDENFGAPNAVDNQTVVLLERLQSTSADERECTCTTIANVIEDKKSLMTLQMNGLVRSMAPLLLDDSPSVREAAAGALRNMSIHGQEVCEKMIEDDVMTPVVDFLQKHAGNILTSQHENVKKDWKEKHNPQLNTLLQIVHLLLNLCETNNTAVNIINKHSVVSLLLDCIRSHQVSLDIAVTSAQCLQTVTEDNKEAVQLCSTAESKAVLEVALLNHGNCMQHKLLQVHTAGTLYNMKDSLSASSQNQTLDAVVKVVSDVLSVDSSETIKGVIPQLQNQGNLEDGDRMANTEGSSGEQLKQLSTTLEENIKESMAILTAQQVALEIISNMCCPEDDSLEELESSSSSSSDDLVEDRMSFEDSPLMSPLCLSAEVHGLLIRHNLPTKVLEKTSYPEKSLLQSLLRHKEGKPLFRGLLRVQSRSLFCLHNIISAVDVDSLGGTEALTLVCGTLMALVMRDPPPKGEELIESLTSAVRSVLQKMAQEKVSPKDLSESHLVRLNSFVQSSTSDSIKVNTVGILGSVGNLLATQQGSEQVLLAVGERLVEVATKDPSLWVVAEALDAIFDTFGDGQMADVVAERIELVPKLKTIAPKLKSKLRQSKTTLGQHLPIVMNARTNLLRFIKYKEEQST